MADKLFADVEQWAEAVAKKTVDKVRDKVIDDVTKKANECINRFYSDPVFSYEKPKGSDRWFKTNEPKEYVRTHNLYNAIQRYSNVHGGYYEFGIKFNPDAMFDNYRGGKRAVMWQALGMGYHGLQVDVAPQTEPSVIDEVQTYCETELLDKTQEYINQALDEAIKEIGVI